MARSRADIVRIRHADEAVTALVGKVGALVAAEDMAEGVAVKGGSPVGRDAGERADKPAAGRGAARAGRGPARSARPRRGGRGRPARGRAA